MRVVTAIGVLALASSAFAQINQLVGTPPNPAHTIDFDNPFVASGPIASNASTFTANGVTSVTLFGTWTTTTDTITAASNASGQSLVSTGGGSGTLSIAGVNQLLDSPSTGAGFDIKLQAPASAFGALFVDQINFNYSIELFSGATSLGVGNFSYSGSFPAPAHYWTGPGNFDRVVITFTATAGVGIDNLMFDVATPPVPVSYCTAGTTTNGCNATISANANPSVTFANPCTITVNNVEGQKTGIVFYGLAPNPQPWCGGGGGSSFLCVKAPTQRTIAASSGGTVALCDGTFGLDWNAFQQLYPTSLGNPFSAGGKVYVQGWFRDPPACKTTSLTDAIEMTFVP